VVNWGHIFRFQWRWWSAGKPPPYALKQLATNRAQLVIPSAYFSSVFPHCPQVADRPNQQHQQWNKLAAHLGITNLDQQCIAQSDDHRATESDPNRFQLGPVPQLINYVIADAMDDPKRAAGMDGANTVRIL